MNIAHHQRQKCYSRNELQGIQILRTKSDRIGQEGEKMNYDKSNIPLMRMGDIRKTLKRTFKVRPGRKIKLKARVRDDGNSTRIIYHTATVIKLYPMWYNYSWKTGNTPLPDTQNYI